MLYVHFLLIFYQQEKNLIQQGQKVSKPRKFFAFLIDALFIFILIMILHLLKVPYHISYFGITILFYILLPFMHNGQTPGKIMTKIVLENPSGTKKYQYLIHYLPLYFLIIPTPYYFYQFLKLSNQLSPLLCYGSIIILIIIFFLTTCQFILSFFSSSHMWFDYYSHLTHVSAITQIPNLPQTPEL